MKKKLIEVALPLDKINAASAREKSIRPGHPSTLHLWWARRPLAACRAVLFASLVDDPSAHPDQFPNDASQLAERDRLFKILEDLVQWENSNDADVLQKARAEILKSTDGNPPPVYDPFCGGGSIPLEAQRLGLEAHASDLNPVAVLITKAMIEIPPKFAGQPPINPESRRKEGMKTWRGAEGLAEDVRHYGKWMRDRAYERIEHLYPKAKLPKQHGSGEATVIAWLWARTVKCPNPACGTQMPLVRSFELSRKEGKEARIEPVVERGETSVRFDVRTGAGKAREGTVGRRGARCLICGEPASLEYVRSEGRNGRMGSQLMAMVAEGRSGRIYLPPSERHIEVASSADPISCPETELPKQALSFRVQAYGMTRHRAFTPRQLVALTTFSDLVLEARQQALRQEADGALMPWREVITPHKDVQSGRFLQAEFAADLWQVYLGEGADEYRLPVEFFRRTYLTEGLKQLLLTSLRRLTAQTADPVVELQTNFGGGKTHSMLALYHLFSGVEKTSLPGLEAVFGEAQIEKMPTVKRAVLVGTKISPGQPERKKDGTIVRTLWGEIAWQLGGREGYEMVRESDERATNPGDRLREVFNKYSPCLVLIDEWVAYARQLWNQGNTLPAGSFDTQASFAQSLTESAKAARNTLLVISIPASEPISGKSPKSVEFSDSEVGGEGGRAALDVLEHKIGRIQSPWRPAAAEESFEIVRRRLFQPISDPNLFRARDAVVKAFAEMYRRDEGEYPSQASQGDYERRLKIAYPIHPDLFESLYNDWSSLERFQRTRGVLRLMASVIHALWTREDRSLVILPASIPIDDRVVKSELLRYLQPTWAPVIDSDVDGADSVPMQMDGQNPNFGRYSACRRVARTLYIGSAPTHDTNRRGRDEKHILLGCVQPGENAGVFSNALHQMWNRGGRHLYADRQRFWYSTQPSVNRLAEDLAAQIEPHKVLEEIHDRIKPERTGRARGDFYHVCDFPGSSTDVADEREAQLVILSPADVHSANADDSPARQKAEEILRSRGSSPRNYPNTISFLAPDRNRYPDLEKAVREFLAWKKICESDDLNLDEYNRKQAEQRRKTADENVDSRIPEIFSWLLIPTRPDPKDTQLEWRGIRLQAGTGTLSQRASKKLKDSLLLLTEYAGALLRLKLDDQKAPLWEGDHIAVRQLIDYFAKYLYLPRLQAPDVLLSAIAQGVATLNVEQEGFGYADAYDASTGRYLGLKIKEHVRGDLRQGLIVKPDMALLQREMEEAERVQRQSGSAGSFTSSNGSGKSETTTSGDQTAASQVELKPRRFYGSVTIDAKRFAKSAGDIAQEVTQHLAAQMGAAVEVQIQISARIPDGAPESVVRTVLENCRTLKFSSFEFEKE